MNKLKYLKLFELVDYNKLIFSMSEEDISDLLLPFTDKGFKLTMRPITVNNNFSEISDRVLRTALLQNKAIGAYLISLKKEPEHESDRGHSKMYSFKSDDSRLTKFISKEISQISKRVEYIEWDVNKSYGSVEVSMLLVCSKKTKSKKSKTRLLIKGEYDEYMTKIESSSLSSILTRIRSGLTTVFRNSMANPSFGMLSSQRKEDINSGKMYLFFRNVSKSVIGTNTRRIESLNLNFSFRSNVENFKVVLKDIDEFKDSNDIQIPYDNIKYVIEINFNYNKFLRICKEKVKYEFIYRNN